MKKYYIYETTNLTNGKKYRGAHTSDSLKNDYLGSGKLLKRAIEKYGIENFNKVILEECSSAEEMFHAEAKWVDIEWVQNPNTYNLKIGGEGGWDYINKNGCRWSEEKRQTFSIEMKKKRHNGEWGPKHPKQPTNGFLGKKHTLESREKISKNNGFALSEEVIQSRLNDWFSIPDGRGKITKLAKMWNVSHTQVRKFINKNLS